MAEQKTGKAPFGVLTVKRVIGWAAPVLMVVAGLSYLVGLAATRGHGPFNWDVASIFGTALGTTALAAFTGALAFTTSGDVRATWRLAELTQEDQAARERPTVVLHHAEFRPAERHVSISFHNVGLGPALNIVFEALVRQDLVPAHPVASPFRWPVQMSGRYDSIALPVSFPALSTVEDVAAASNALEPDAFEIRATYEDRRGHVYDLVQWGSAGPDWSLADMADYVPGASAEGTAPDSSQKRGT